MINAAEILNLSGGYVKVEVSGDFTERFLNMCAAKNIYIWDVVLRGSKTLRCKTSVKGFKEMRGLRRITHTRVHIISRCGAPFAARRLIKRKGLIAGFLGFVVLTVWLCSHIWYIEIADGGLEEGRMRELLNGAGIRCGAAAYGIDPATVQAEILSNAPELAWVWPEVKGTKVYVDYRVRVAKPEMLDINRPCNLIASENGQITSMLIKEGRTVVAKDMYVSKGQLLVGGAMDSSAVGGRLVHSDGEVWATTHHSIGGEYSLTAEEKSPTGREKTMFGIKFGETLYNLPSGENKFKDFEAEEEEFHFRTGDIYFPISLVKTTLSEVETNIINSDREKIIEEAKEYLEKSLQNSFENVIILERAFVVDDKDENTVSVTMNAVCSQQIAQKQPIEEEMYGGKNN